MSITQYPTEKEIKAIEQEGQFEVRSYTLYKYQCHHPRCHNEFISNLDPRNAICPFSPVIHDRKGRTIRLIDRIQRTIQAPVFNIR